MAVTKPIASLSSSLLARKGQAKPAMRPQGYASLAMTNMSPDSSHMPGDDLGWNDMGHESHDPYVTLKVTPNVAAPQLTPMAVVGSAPQPIGEIERAIPAVVKLETVQAATIQPANEDVAAPVTSSAIPVVVEQHRELAARLGATVEAPATVAKSTGKKAKTKAEQPNIDKTLVAANKAAFTLRLDEDRHLRLRLASAVSRQSAQRLVTEALDRFLEGLTDIDQLTGHLNASAATRRH